MACKNYSRIDAVRHLLNLASNISILYTHVRRNITLTTRRTLYRTILCSRHIVVVISNTASRRLNGQYLPCKYLVLERYYRFIGLLCFIHQTLPNDLGNSGD